MISCTEFRNLTVWSTEDKYMDKVYLAGGTVGWGTTLENGLVFLAKVGHCPCSGLTIRLLGVYGEKPLHLDPGEMSQHIHRSTVHIIKKLETVWTLTAGEYTCRQQNPTWQLECITRKNRDARIGIQYSNINLNRKVTVKELYFSFSVCLTPLSTTVS